MPRSSLRAGHARRRVPGTACGLLLAALLSGCALLPRIPPPAPPLLPPAALGGARDASQVINMAYGDKEISLQCEVDVTPERVTVVALGPLGQRAFTLTYDGAEVHADLSPYVPSNLPPERILADLELALWPLAAWTRLPAEGDWQVSAPREGMRRLRYKTRLVSEVHYDGAAAQDPWNGRLWLVNAALGYTLDMQSSTAP